MDENKKNVPSAVQWLLALGCLNAAGAIALGAFGAHLAQSRFSDQIMVVYQTAVQYHLFHSLGLMAAAGIRFLLPDGDMIAWAGWIMLAAMVLFSGSLYLLCFTAMRWWGAVTPFGGTGLIVAWVMLAAGTLKRA